MSAVRCIPSFFSDRFVFSAQPPACIKAFPHAPVNEHEARLSPRLEGFLPLCVCIPDETGGSELEERGLDFEPGSWL